jgi:hypothetical protein
MRHEGCGRLAGKAELLTGIEGASRSVRRIVLRVDERRRTAVTTFSVSPADATAGCGISQHASHVASEHRTLLPRLTTNVKWRP